jgi:hypothetical protein
MAVAVPDNSLSNNMKYPVTLNMFSMPDEYFVYTVAVLAQSFNWSGLNMVCNTRGSFTFKLCMLFPEFLTSSVTKNLAWDRFDGHWLHEDEPGYHPPDFTSLFPHLLKKRGTRRPANVRLTVEKF